MVGLDEERYRIVVKHIKNVFLKVSLLNSF